MKRSATSLIISTFMLCTVGATSQIQAADTLAKIK
ncbi:MAG: amino acid ABC transporter substrate-binding protein, partial [Acinetobacter calcoaceticus]